MITEAIINVFLGLIKLVVGLFPSSEPPLWMTQSGSYLQDVWLMGAGLGAWVPWSLLGNVVGAVLGAVAIGFLIKIVRIVASFFTAGGGSAA